MAHGEYQMNEDGEMKAEGSVQVKGYHSSEYSVQTQYEVTLYEWDVFVDGRADLMAWDMYLNLGARETQSAYHEYFLAVQVESGQPFTIDQFNFISNFDTGWYDPFRHELGISLEGMTISQPYYEPVADTEDPDSNEEDTGSSAGYQDTGVEQNSDKDTASSFEFGDSSQEPGSKSSSGCSCSTSSTNRAGLLFGLLALFSRRKENHVGA